MSLPMKDYPSWYERISAPWRARPGAARVMNALDKGLVAAVAAAYIGVLVWLLMLLATQGDARFWRALLVPAVSFVLVSAARSAINAPRPYEQYDINPIIKKDTHGKSFPSRHLFSAAIIACALWWVSPALGAPAFAACIAVAFCRIVGGVHFPRDIAGAFAFALTFGAIGFILIP